VKQSFHAEAVAMLGQVLSKTFEIKEVQRTMMRMRRGQENCPKSARLKKITLV